MSDVRKKAGRSKTAGNGKTAAKKAAGKASKASGTAASTVSTGPEERWRMIAVAAYHMAEKRGFAPGGEMQDWIEAEQEIDRLIS